MHPDFPSCSKRLQTYLKVYREDPSFALKFSIGNFLRLEKTSSTKQMHTLVSLSNTLLNKEV